MSDPRHDTTVKALAQGALKLDSALRPDYLLQSCAENPDLLNDVCAELAGGSPAHAMESTVAIESFDPGSVIGQRFRIVRFIAQGGMGCVYEADDLQLGGRVAVKTIRSDRVSKESLERFRSEVQISRKVTHRNVCRIFDLGTHQESGSSTETFFLTMEFLEGKTLHQRIRESPIATAEIVGIVRQVALALAAAHENNIVHRDLKGSNIILVPVENGFRTVVTDFGLALAVAPASLPASDRRKGRPIEGTPPYMSPEQLVGGPVGPRSDLYSLGVVMFEMATGKLPYSGDVRQRLQGDAPRPSAVAPSVDRGLEAIILHCLRRNPQERVASAHALLLELDRTFGPDRRLGIRPGTRFRIVAAASLITIAAVVSAWSFWRRPFTASPAAPTFTPVTNQPGEQLFPALSPDGANVAYAWENRGKSGIYRQAVSGGQPVDITPECGNGDSEPAWSPDGRRIAYRCEKAGGGISIASADGASDRKLTSVGHQPSWSPDGNRLVVATERVADMSGLMTLSSPLWIVDARNGATSRLPGADGFQPSWSPGGYRIAYWAYVDGRRCIRTAAAFGRPSFSELISDTHLNWNPVWSADGHWLYFLSDRGGSMNLWRIGVDEKSGAPSGSPEPVTLPATYVLHVSVSRDGRSIAYVQRTQLANLFRIPFDTGTGKTGTPEQLTFGVRFDSMPDVSPDGASVSFISGFGKPDQIYVMPASPSAPLRQITDNTDKSVRILEPRWSPDGKRIAFQSNSPADGGRRMNQIWSVGPDGSDLKQLTHMGQHAVSPVWSPDGSRLAYSVVDGHPWLLSLATLRSEEFATPPDSIQFIAKSWSADGARIAGSRHRPDGASDGIVVYTPGDRRYETVTSFGSAPVWLKDGVRLLFRSGASLYLENTRRHISVPLTLDSSIRVSDTFTVSGDNRWLIVSSSTEQANVWVARNLP